MHTYAHYYKTLPYNSPSLLSNQVQFSSSTVSSQLSAEKMKIRVVQLHACTCQGFHVDHVQSRACKSSTHEEAYATYALLDSILT